MATEIWVAILALLGTSVGSITGILVANRLSNYRIEQLEKKVDKHNCVIERMAVVENEIKTINNRLQDLESA